MFDMIPATFFENMAKHQEKYGKMFRLKMLSQKFLHISDAPLCREIFQKRPKLLVRGHVLDPMATSFNYLPYGLFHSNDAVVWGRMRKMTSPAFSKQNLTNMSGLLYLEVMDFVRQLHSLCMKSEKIDMVKEATGYTVRVISRVAFGNDQVDYFFGEQFYKDVRATFDIMLESAMFPFPRWIWMLTPHYKQELLAVEANKRFSAACQEVISIKRAQHAQMSEEEKKHTRSLIDIMIRQDGYNDDEVLANVKTFYLAGSDTTSMSISWAVYLLAQHPAIVEKVRLEAQQFFAAVEASTAPVAVESLTHDNMAIYEALGAMVFTHAVLKESIRLFPAGPAIFLDFACAEEAEPLVLSTGLTVPTDTTLLLNVWQCLLDERYFENPRTFQPDRWLTEDRALLGRMDQGFLGFGAGARACPGMGLAMDEGTMALAAIFHYFDVELMCPAEEVKPEFKFTLQPSKLPVKITPRAGMSL
eukprot:CAMPEP_0170377832 /NCGR_PEP_ID=MMETSP0117_2-20130122/12483_1 /TAXON_ID=400756 /ORGANISM="Durinskia baltica, Strain CSIRO CS-38" /LENGTH=472 /DNA_ID=CAMNT_0010633157 /DNA_START=273 /DNA_END=1691 /DNA_ORIENTATION=+